MKIVDIKPKVNHTLIESLEKLLTDAYAGEVQGVAYVTSYENGNTGNGWVGIDDNVIPVIGEVEILKLELINNFVEMRDEHSQ